MPTTKTPADDPMPTPGIRAETKKWRLLIFPPLTQDEDDQLIEYYKTPTPRIVRLNQKPYLNDAWADLSKIDDSMQDERARALYRYLEQLNDYLERSPDTRGHKWGVLGVKVSQRSVYVFIEGVNKEE